MGPSIRQSGGAGPQGSHHGGAQSATAARFAQTHTQIPPVRLFS